MYDALIERKTLLLKEVKYLEEIGDVSKSSHTRISVDSRVYQIKNELSFIQPLIDRYELLIDNHYKALH